MAMNPLFHSRLRSGLAAAILPGFLTASAMAGMSLPRSTPEAQGVSPDGLRAFLETADREIKSMHSFMLVRHGKVVAEAWWKPEAPDKPHQLWSLSKSFTSTAVGLAVADGKLKPEDKVLSFFPDLAPADPPEHLKAMTVKDLLTMTAGHETEAKLNAADPIPWVKTFLVQPVPYAPGTHFKYNTPATHMLSAIVTKVTGETVLDYLKPRLFDPLGITNPQWAASPQGNTLGGWGLFVCTEDIAKFGQLYLQKGQWLGKTLVPASWVEQATAKQVPNDAGRTDKETSDWAQGYGYQFWRCRHGAYRGDGKDGQFCLVLPEQDAVVAITALTGDMQHQLNVVWDHLLPAFRDAPLPEQPEAVAALKTFAAGLTVRPAVPAK